MFRRVLPLSLLGAVFGYLFLVTLAHHLLNAVQGIGGFAALAIKREQDGEKRRPLERIRNRFSSVSSGLRI